MEKFKFNKPLIESKLSPESTNVYWVDVDEHTKKIASIKEFKDGKWVSVLGADSGSIQDFVETTVVENGEFVIHADSPYTAVKEVQLNVNVRAQEADFTTLRAFGGTLTLEEGSSYSGEMVIPVTTPTDKVFPIKFKVGTTGYVVFGTLTSSYNSVTNTSTQEIRYTSGTSTEKFMRTYENGQWTTWVQ